MAGELEALRFAAGERRYRLPQAQVIESDVGQRPQHACNFAVAGEEGERLRYRHVEHVGDGFHHAARAIEFHFQHLGAVAPAVAVRAAQVDVGEELHLDVLETVAAARGAAAVAGVEAERAGGIAAFLRGRGLREQFPDGVESTDVARGVGASGAPDRRLVHQHDAGDALVTFQCPVLARRLGGLAFHFAQGRVEHVLHQRGFPGPGHTGDADQPLEREGNVDVLQVVLAGAENLDAWTDFPRRGWSAAARPLAAREVIGGKRIGRPLQFLRRAEAHDAAAAFPRPGAEVENAVGGKHDLGVVLDDHQRVAGIAQLFHDADHAAHVARVQSDRRLVEREQRIGERGAERGGEIDALHFTAGEGSRLAVEREVAQPHVREIAEPRAHLGQQQVGRLVHGRRQTQLLEKRPRALDRQQHEIVHRQPRQRCEPVFAPVDAARQKAPGGPECGVRILLRAHPPQQGAGLEPRTAARLAGRIGAVAGEQHADVHLVGPGFQPLEVAGNAVPRAGPGLAPAHPAGIAFEHPPPVLRGELAPRCIERHAALLRVLHEVVVPPAIRFALPRPYRTLAQRLPFIRYHEPEIHADHAAEAAAGLARADRRIERVEAGCRLFVVDVAIRAVEIR